MFKNLFDLKNKLIIVAGGAGQIGFSMATSLADYGAKIIILDNDIGMMNEKLEPINEEIKNKINFFKLDVTKKNQIKKVYKKIFNKYGSPYGLINCFHYKGNNRKLDINSSFFSDFENYPEEAWDMVIDVNLKGSFLMSQEILPYFKKNNEGNIVNISSTYGVVSPNPSIYGESGINSPVSYSASKAGVLNLTRYLSVHLAKYNIRVNCLTPGGVFNNQSDEFVKNYTEKTPLGRMAKTQDYNGGIVYLMSDSSSYMTGSNLIIDGGWTSW